MSATRKTPRTTAAQWRAVTEVMAVQLASHAFCDEHPTSSPGPDCPSCDDRAAYGQYLLAGGTDTRMKFAGQTLVLCARCVALHAGEPCGPGEIGVTRQARTRAVCPVCNLDYALTKAGRIGRHNGMTLAGFSTGKSCEGVGQPPKVDPR